jgi:hypothetical protein
VGVEARGRGRGKEPWGLMGGSLAPSLTSTQFRLHFKRVIAWFGTGEFSRKTRHNRWELIPIEASSPRSGRAVDPAPPSYSIPFFPPRSGLVQ